MARKARNTPAGHVYHVLNRSAGRIALFRRDADYAAFERIIIQAKARVDLPERSKRERSKRGRS